MRKNITIIILACAFVLSSAIPAFATDSTSIEYLPDGSYYETTITTKTPAFALFASASTKTDSKTVIYKNSAGSILWYVKVTGSFSYNGTTSSCTSSTVTAAAQSSSWTIASKSASKSGNTATANVVAKEYHNGILNRTVSRTVTLTCSKTGVLS